MTDLEFAGLRRTACARACIITAYLRDEEEKKIGNVLHRMQPIVLGDEGNRTTNFFSIFHYLIKGRILYIAYWNAINKQFWRRGDLIAIKIHFALRSLDLNP